MYTTLLQKRNSLALFVQQSGAVHHVQVIKFHHVVETSLRYNQSHSISLKYFPSLVVGNVHVHEYRSPLC